MLSFFPISNKVSHIYIDNFSSILNLEKESQKEQVFGFVKKQYEQLHIWCHGVWYNVWYRQLDRSLVLWN